MGENIKITNRHVRHKSGAGFTLIETIVGITIFLLITTSIFYVYVRVIELVSSSRFKISATALANEQFEIARNLPYEDVGIAGGIPYGKLNHIQSLIRDNITFTLETTVRNVDDVFDSTIGGTPNDTSPADYKLVELYITCASCKHFTPLTFSTHISPRALETASTNGALFVEVFDSLGLPVSNADIVIENNQQAPAISIQDKTNNEGVLQIVDAPPGVEAYEITVSKSGYSSEQTYASGIISNPNPLKPHSTVAIQQLTEISFSIDRTSTLNIESVGQTCSSIANAEFLLQGEKLIGTNPDVLKYSASHTTNGLGQTVLSNMEWDTYNASLNTNGYMLAGTIPLLPLLLSPNTNQNLKLVLEPDNPNSLLVTIKDNGTHLPLTDVDVRLQKTGYDTTLTTGQGFLRQTDWSDGAGQEDFINQSKYFDSDDNIEISDPEGEVHLKNVFGEYESSGYLISSTFDTGSSSNFHQLLWQPQSQPTEAGDDSVKFQIATNNDNATWNFVGPDGTLNSYYTLSTPDINTAHNGDRYLRYKLFLSTNDTNFSPNVGEVAFTFTSECVPPGQVFFSGLSNGSYDIAVSKSGYTTFNDTITINSSWTEQEVLLAP